MLITTAFLHKLTVLLWYDVVL